MNSTILSSAFNIIRNRSACLTTQFTRAYAKPVAAASTKKVKKMGKLGPIVEKKVIPVETDVNKLVNYVCGSNIYKTGEDIKLKPDSEYPDWLWSLKVDGITPLEELDPNTKQYWRRLRRTALRRNNQLAKLKKF